MPDVPRYEFPPRDSTGWILGLSGAQCVVLAAGAGAAGRALTTPAVAIAVVVATVIAAFGGTGGELWVTKVPVAARWAARALRRGQWLPMPSPTSATTGGSPVPLPLPRPLGPVHVEGVATGWWPDPVAVATGARGRRATVVLAVRGDGFALRETADQTVALAQWADALAGCCRERSPVAQIAVISTTMCPKPGPVRRPLGDYDEVVAAAAAAPITDDVLVAVTVDGRRLHRGRRTATPTGAAVEEARLLARRLDDAGLEARPLDVGALCAAVRRRLDPTRPLPATLATVVDARTPANCGPLAFAPAWDHVHVDGTFHAAFWVAEWPRGALGPAWMEPFLLSPRGARTLTLLVAPVAPSVSRRRVQRDATRLAADREQRARGGFRIAARAQRLAEAVEEREAELLAGHAEVAFLGVLIVAAATLDELDALVAEEIDHAAAVGLELRRLDGRHHSALAAALPLGGDL